ncbi:kinesin-like protein KIF20B [Perca flavescens]|uniref:kinesin-like protein KIF20B n=1 Tax=Perca flavescens TaxID=8167 RepID=UPI00106E051E|nr:kinesin-like protein KIF20B [Perca flavescens]
MVEELKEEIQKLQERKRRQEEETKSRQFDAVKKEVERLKEERDTQRCGVRVFLPEQDVFVSPLRSNMADRKKSPKTTGRKRKSCEVQDLVFSENKRNRVRGNTQRNNKQVSSSVVKEKRDGPLQKIGELLHSSPSILGSKAKTIIGLVSGHSVEKETVTTATKPKRGRKKLFKTSASSPLLDSPNMTSGGEKEEKESDHLIIRRQLRSKTCRK